MRRLVAASSFAQLEACALEWIEPLVNRGEILVVGATRAACDEFVRAVPGAGSFGIHRATVAQLAARGRTPATRLAAEAIAARVTDQALRAGALRYYTPVARAPGFASALVRTIEDLRLAGAAPSGDLAWLLAAYEKELAAQGLTDLAGMLWQPSEPRAMPVLLLDVPLPSSAHAAFVGGLVAGAPNVCATVLAADGQRVAKLEQLLACAARTFDEASGDALAHARRYVFSPQSPPATDYDQTLQLFSAPGEALEAVEIARRIAHAGIPFDRIAILLRHPARYQPLVEEALRRASIPAWFSRGTARPDPDGRAFLALLACAAEGCSATRFAEYLSLGRVPSVDASGAAPRQLTLWPAPDDDLFGSGELQSAKTGEPANVPAPLAWEKLLVDAAVIGGYERWERRLEGLDNEFRIQLASLEGQEQAERERLEREIERLGHLERFALPLIEDLHALPASAPWREWLAALGSFASRALLNPQPVLAVLAELRPMGDAGPVELDEVVGVLTPRLRTLRVEPAARRYGRVFVGAIDEVRGRAFELVFLPGLAEGLFPNRAIEDPLLADHRRIAISPELATNDQRIAEERLLLHTALAAARSAFVASYPSVDAAQGRQRVPSFYALEIARSIEAHVPRLRAFEQRLGARGEARLSWPAPQEPTHAIDDAEFDLAWLRAHRAEPAGARYLTEVNQHLRRSLRTRWRRWERKWTDSDGFAGDTRLASERPSLRDYSPSALELYALCPYRFALSGVMRLRERREAAAIEQMDPLTRGSLVHEVQREFLRAWRRDPTEDLDALFPRLDETLERVARSYADEVAPAIPRVWRAEVDDVRTDLRGWLLAWHGQLAEWEPLYFELGFGLGRPDAAHDEGSEPEPVNVAGALVRGSIDLIERHRATGKLRITDFKTGRTPDNAPTVIGGGSVLQPVLYSLVSEKLLNASAQSGRLYYCTQRGAYTEHEIPITPPARAAFARAMALVDDAVADGFLPAAPAENACAQCEFAAVCGPHEQVRARRWKDSEALEALNQLRSIP